MTATPLISVIMPVYNCQQYVYEAVQSILNQTYAGFELIIIDDCSTDDTVKIISSISDSRIRLIVKEVNSGYTDSLNLAIGLAKGDFIARMDGDDISMPRRFEIQLGALAQNPNVILCGGAIKIIGSDRILRHPEQHDDIKLKLCFSNSLFHPTVMARKEILLQNPYDKNFEPAEDYDLWTKLAFKGELLNVGEILLHYRVHPHQVSNSKSEVQLNAAAVSRLRMFQVLFRDALDIGVFKEAFQLSPHSRYAHFGPSLRLFNDIRKNNDTLKVYRRAPFNERIDKLRINYLKAYFRKKGFSVKALAALTLSDYLALLRLKMKSRPNP